MRDGRDLVIVASKGGHPRNPAWLHNLRAHPDTEVQIGTERMPVHAREASEEERRRLWPLLIAHNPHWERYQAAHRAPRAGRRARAAQRLSEGDAEPPRSSSGPLGASGSASRLVSS